MVAGYTGIGLLIIEILKECKIDNEMIDRCAKAIALIHNIDDKRYKNYISAVKACIKAMREPTENVIDAGLRATAVHLDIKGSQLTINRGKMLARFNAMINAILND